MARSLPLIAALLLGGSVLAAEGAGAAGQAAGADAARRAGSTFMVMVNTTGPLVPVVAPAAGVAPPPARPVVANPYHVPLLQGAGSLHFSR